MRKLTKLSLVAAVAVAGLTTSASAVALEEAIKGVDVSGYVRYRLESAENGQTNTTNPDTVDDAQSHRYTIVTNTTIPTGDFTKANVGIRVDGRTNNGTSDVGTSNEATEATIVTANFTATLGKTTVIAGKQYLNTPLTHNGWDTGTGILALNSSTPVTLAAGFFANTEDTTIDKLSDAVQISQSGNEDENLMVLAAIGKLGPVDAQAWYFDISDVAKAYYLEAAANVGPANVRAQYVNTNYDEDSVSTAAVTSDTDEHTFTGVEVAANVANINVAAVYTTTGNEGGLVTIDNANDDAGLISVGEQANVTTINTLGDHGTVYGVAASMPVIAGITAGVDFATIDDRSDANNDGTEWVLRASYQVDKKLALSAYYSVLEDDAVATPDDITESRVEVRYSF
jgi:hypothetical protein